MIFSSSKTLIQRATIKNTKKQVVIKKSVEDFASFAVTESIKRDYQFSKILHQSYPEYFLNMIQILEQKNGGVVLIMEDMGLEEQEFLELAKKMTRALHFVHSKQILHRDIKLANFVYNSKTQKLNLIDFGLSTMVTRKSPSVSCHAPTEAEKIGGMKNIHQLKPCTDDEIILLLKVIFDSLDVMYLAPSANPLIVVMATLTSLYMYFKEGLTFNAALGLNNDGKAIMANAEKLLARDKNPKYNVVATQFFLGATCIFAGNLKQQVYYLDSALKYAQNHGEYLFGAYSAFDGCSALSLNGENFNTLIPKLIKRKAWLKQVKNFFFLDFVEGLINLISDLAGVSKWNPKFIIPNFESIKCADTFVPTVQGILAYHKGDYENALTFFQKAEPFNNNMLGFWDYYESKFYHCMCMIYFYKMNGEYFDKINQFLEEFKPLGENGSEYLAPRYRLMELYFQSVESQDKLTIISSLEELLDSATTFGLIIVAAMISEIILEICDENKMPKVKIWSGLSAKTKVDQFKKKYYKYLSQRSSSNSGFNATTT
eukprot:gene12547-6368_t